MKKTFLVNVEWVCSAIMEIEAETEMEACEKARNMPLPIIANNENYLSDSFNILEINQK